MASKTETQPPRDVQVHSKLWWEKCPMSYDWRGTNPWPEGTPEFYDEIDRRFFSSSPFYAGRRPFEKLIPFDHLMGKRVLEIGCGMGAHAQLLTEAGCQLTCIDLTERAVQLTRKRLALRQLPADVRRMDAETMDFRDGEFDFVWSWGVIHHSADTEGIVRQVHRVLKPGGEFRLMVYHKRSLSACTSLARGFASGKVFKGMSVADILSSYTDGHLARYYTKREFIALLKRHGFSSVQACALGQKSEILPLPGQGAAGRWKLALLARVPDRLAQRFLSAAGSFLFAIARKGPLGPASP